jgi:hypothetical protein
MRVQHGLNATLCRDRGYAIEVGQEGLPSLLVEFWASVVSLTAAVGGENEDAGSGSRVALENAFHLGHRIVSRHVQQERGEPAHGLQVVLGQDLGHGIGLAGQEAFGPQLGCHQADLTRLAQNSLRTKLIAPPGHLTHAPGDGSAGDLSRLRGSGVGGHEMRTSQSALDGVSSGPRAYLRDAAERRLARLER